MEKYKYDWKSIIAGLVVLLIGILMILLDMVYLHTAENLWISIGCSLIASAIVILFTAVFVERKRFNPLDEWGITRIFATRAEKNSDSDPQLEKTHYCVDAVAFGLKAFRSKQTKRIEQCLKRGVNIRILTMQPNSPFVKQRALEENETEDQIAHTIEDLVKWANQLNSQNYKGKIVIKGYNCMTLDFYWRLDDTLYIGPYCYGIPSQQTITYKFVAGGKGFSTYTDYFEDLWNDNNLSAPLTEVTEFAARKRIRK